MDNAKNQIVDIIKNNANILVTVSTNPSVDELSAALGLTILLNNMDKRATAVFSGGVPPAINFLEPDKTFENSADSLRDFIIALDKEKADHLRYKVDGDVVKIFITPYKTTLSQNDLDFSQGDYNVEVVLALGVKDQDHLDKALEAHGKILHDANVLTITAGADTSNLGSIDWHDGAASSLSEMVVGLADGLKTDKPLLDEQTSTALLTGIVSATDRFRNEHTSPKVMTMAAQLMAAGANQQLIATKLEEGHVTVSPESAILNDGSKHLAEGESEKLNQPSEEPAPQQKPDGEMTIAHEAPADELPKVEAAPEPVTDEPLVDATAAAEAKIDEVLAGGSTDAASGVPMTPPLSIDDLKRDLAAASEEVNAAAEPPISDIKGNGNWRDRPMAAPAFGGTLNATTDEAEDAKRREEESNQNHKLLTHDGPASEEPPLFDQSVSATQAPEPEAAPVPEPTPEEVTPPHVEDPLVEPINSEPDSVLSYEPTPAPGEVTGQTLSEIEAQAHGASVEHVDDARAAVDAALSAMPFDPAREPMQGMGAQPLGEDIHPVAPIEPPLPVIETIQPAPAPEPYVAPAPAPMTPALPPLPDFSTLPPLPGEQPPHPAMIDPTLAQDTAVAVPADPGQFKLPGQP